MHHRRPSLECGAYREGTVDIALRSRPVARSRMMGRDLVLNANRLRGEDGALASEGNSNERAIL